MRWLPETAAVNCLQTPISTLSFAANRGRSLSRDRSDVSRCDCARILPYRSIWSALNNSDRSGSSSSRGLRGNPLLRRRALNCVRCPKIDVLFVTNCVIPFSKMRAPRRGGQSAACAAGYVDEAASPACLFAPWQDHRLDDASVPEQFCQRVQLLHVLRHDFDDDDDGNAE